MYLYCPSVQLEPHGNEFGLAHVLVLWRNNFCFGLTDFGIGAGGCFVVVVGVGFGNHDAGVGFFHNSPAFLPHGEGVLSLGIGTAFGEGPDVEGLDVGNDGADEELSGVLGLAKL
jgi:hypothetical protein